MKRRFCGGLALSILCLSGCGLLDTPAESAASDGALIADLSDETAVEARESKPVPVVDLPALRKVARPKGSEWLLEPIELTLDRMDMVDAMSLVAGSHGARFELVGGVSPLAVYASGADARRIDALNALSTQADWTWNIEDGLLVIKDVETRTLLLLAQPGSVSSTLSVNALDGGKSRDRENDGGAVAQELDPYDDEIAPMVAELLAADADKGYPVSARLLPSANALLITARPSTVKRVSGVIDLYNQRVSQSVRVRLTVFEVTSTSKHSVGSRLTALAAAGAGLGGNFGWNVRPLEPTGQFSVTATDATSRFAGSELLLEWLDSEGDATINFNDSIEVRNNQIAASSSTRTYQYISSITREQDALGRERTEVARDSLRTGWSISVHPTIGLDQVTVRLSMARRALVDERPFQFGESQGTNFVTDDQIRAMTVSLADGETRIITALDSLDERSNRNKLGGLVTRRGGTQMKTESVLLMRVEVI